MKKENKSIEYYLILILFSILILVSLLQVLFRFVLNLPLAWTEELARYVFITLIYCGASSAAASNRHVRVELIDGVIPVKYRWVSNVIMRLFCSAFCIIIAFNNLEVVKNAHISEQLSASMRIPMWMIYSIVLLMFLLIAFRFLQTAYYCFCTRKDGELTE